MWSAVRRSASPTPAGISPLVLFCFPVWWSLALSLADGEGKRGRGGGGHDDRSEVRISQKGRGGHRRFARHLVHSSFFPHDTTNCHDADMTTP
ncbi:uncharacterized protein BO66DRAFT_41427 [Aspergillus aculeatinus CBS 121060]|uniref:Uncharacterized protein n=1 Tax=Aspergillus aculeatinus CBS 121060 TaxID=1448322 RepID=A0ACD1HE37_9EURO|nr:hypothetical protein BO66DRAFT_41427 [Aspergillus aculeatinus CBS 121060]RAH71853.1 hypothetical protein BO66DRAFT_41427 [Aspergillus aculeatinus CBS 121060]